MTCGLFQDGALEAVAFVSILLRAYGEASKPKDSSLLTVSAFLGHPDKWTALQKTWRKARAESSVEHFHMTDFMNPKHPVYGKWTQKKRDAVIGRLIDLINKTALFGASVTLNVSDFDALEPEDKAMCGNNPYALAASQCIGYTVKLLEEEARVDAKVFWIIAAGDEGGKAFFKQIDVFEQESLNTLRIVRLMPGAQKKWPALDTADFLAWCEMNHAMKYRAAGVRVDPTGYLTRVVPPTSHHYMAGDTLLKWAREDLTPTQKAAITKIFGVHSGGPISPQKKQKWSRAL